jgi:integrase
MGDYWRVKDDAVALLNEIGTSTGGIDQDSASFAKLCEGLLAAEIRGLDYHKDRLTGTASTDLERAFDGVLGKGATVVPAVSEAVAEPSILLSELWEQYQAEHKKAGRWAPSTIKKYQPQIRTMIQVVGDVPINTISSDQMREYRQILDNLPPNFSKKDYKDLTGIKLADLKGKFVKHLDISTILGYMDLASSLFDFAVDNEYIERNPIPKGIIPHKKVRPKDKRHAFSDPEDLERIFERQLFLSWSKDKPERFWVPLLALYTGCRLEEACQINVTDVKQVDDLWCIEFSGATTALELEDGKKRGESKKLKTGSSPRTIPLHPFLVEDLRFPQYVQKQHDAGKEMVFQHLVPVKERTGVLSHYLSKQGNYYLKRNVKIGDDRKKFYSLRHTVATHLQNQMVTEWMIEELEGRAGKTETSKTYAKGFRMPVLYREAILKLNYKVDLSHLTESDYVLKGE